MLNDSYLKKHHRKELDSSITKADRDGLYVKISPKGKITFIIRYYFDGSQDYVKIGTYPQMTLKQARDRNEYLRGMLDKGYNPKLVVKSEVEKITERITIKELFDLWYEKECKEHQKHHYRIYTLFRKHILLTYGDHASEDIPTHKWFSILEGIKKDVPYSALTLLSQIKKMYAFAVRRNLLDSNPLQGMSGTKDLYIRQEMGERFLNDSEIQRVFYCINAGGINRRSCLVIMLSIHFGCRMGEIVGARMDEFDFNDMVWTIPKERHKTGKKVKQGIKRPITEKIKPVIDELAKLSLNKKYLLSTNDKKPIDYNIWRRYPDVINNWLERNGYEKIEPWTCHALRKTMRTNVGAFAPPHVAEIMLGHKQGGVQAVYDKYDYLKEQLDAYMMWETKLDMIINNSDNVTLINFKK